MRPIDRTSSDWEPAGRIAARLMPWIVRRYRLAHPGEPRIETPAGANGRKPGRHPEARPGAGVGSFRGHPAHLGPLPIA